MTDIKLLKKSELEKIYQNYIMEDFPDNERRPLENMIFLMKQGKYAAYGFYKNNQLCGYALIYGQKDIYLLDYFAIIKDYRNQHFGSEFLKMLLEQYQDKFFFLEAENPDIAPDQIKKRRINFYQRAGLKVQKTLLYLYFVNYVILANRAIDQKTLENFYHGLYSDEFYQRYIDFQAK